MKRRRVQSLPERRCTVRVTWCDAYFNGARQVSPGDELESYVEVNTVGILYENNSERVVLVAEQMGREERYRQVTVIPKSVVLKIEKIGDWAI